MKKCRDHEKVQGPQKHWKTAGKTGGTGRELQTEVEAPVWRKEAWWGKGNGGEIFTVECGAPRTMPLIS